MLSRCVGTLVNSKNILCSVGIMTEQLYLQMVASWRAVYLVLAEMLMFAVKGFGGSLSQKVGCHHAPLLFVLCDRVAALSAKSEEYRPDAPQFLACPMAQEPECSRDSTHHYGAHTALQASLSRLYQIARPFAAVFDLHAPARA
jgi:hypothetical protein